jgi:hypothetical protein
VVGAAFVDGGILPGNGTLPLEHSHISRFKIGFDLPGDLIDPVDQIFAIGFAGTEVSGDDHGKIFLSAVPQFDKTACHKSKNSIIC